MVFQHIKSIDFPCGFALKGVLRKAMTMLEASFNCFELAAATRECRTHRHAVEWCIATAADK
jgi:hypothetical protein